MVQVLLRAFLFPCIAILWATHYYIEVLQAPEAARYTIKPVYFLLLFLFVSICVKEVRKIKAMGTGCDKRDGQQTYEWLMPFCCLSFSGLLVAVIPLLGFAPASVLFLLCLFLYHNPRSYIKSLIVAILFVATVCFVFEHFFGVFLPNGIFF